jgi:hypothetical protein
MGLTGINMANCKSCTHSESYPDPKDGITKRICLSPHKETMATVEGEHECEWYKLDEWDEKRMDIISSNGNDGLHYEDENNG